MDRFSQVYLFGGPLTEDSARFRLRVASLYETLALQHYQAVEFEVTRLIQRECGVRIGGMDFRNVGKFFEKAEMRDVLDALSLVPRGLSATRYYSPRQCEDWRVEIGRYFREENLAYRIGKDYVVHRFVDEEFHQAAAAALQGLGASQLGPAKIALARSIACLTNVQQDTKGAVLAIFEACEIVAKHLVPEAKNLNSFLCKNRLASLCMSPGATGAELKVETGVFAAMAEWVDAVHNYRHGQAEAEVVAPSLELAVQLVSMGCGFSRRLAQAYARSAPSDTTTEVEPTRTA